MNLPIKQLKKEPGMAFPFSGQIELPPIAHGGTVMAQGSRVAFHGRAVYQGGKVHLTLALKAEVERECSRCLAHFTQTVEKEEEITLREEHEVRLEDDDFTYPDEAEEVAIEPYLQSLILSALGPKPLCAPDCRGLCPSCGVNLNEEEHHPDCPALRPEVDPRLAQLLDLL
jgi:uncharacterized protein